MLARTGLQLAGALLCRSSAALPAQGLATLSLSARPAVACIASAVQMHVPATAMPAWSTAASRAWMQPFGQAHSQPFTTFPAHLQQAQPKPAEPGEPAGEHCSKRPPDGQPVVDAEVLTDPDKTFGCGYIAPHPGLAPDLAKASQHDYLLFHPVYTKEYVDSVAPKHKEPTRLRDRIGLGAVSLMRWVFDKATGYGPDMNENKWLRRAIFLETIAGVPGMMGGMVRHLQSLRLMRRDNGWIHTLLEEAENERMHLLTFLQLRQPGWLFRTNVMIAQGVFSNLYFLCYLLSPRTCHAFIGYLEEEAVRTYTHAIADLRAGKLPEWENKAAPDIAVNYWQLGKGATMLDLLLAVRADEACHSHVNHTLSSLSKGEPNPFARGQHDIQMP